MTDPGTKVCACGKHQDYRQPPAEPASSLVEPDHACAYCGHKGAGWDVTWDGRRHLCADCRAELESAEPTEERSLEQRVRHAATVTLDDDLASLLVEAAKAIAERDEAREELAQAMQIIRGEGIGESLLSAERQRDKLAEAAKPVIDAANAIEQGWEPMPQGWPDLFRAVDKLRAALRDEG
jgi:hypothetical protein